jgi:hypothetical protein
MESILIAVVAVCTAILAILKQIYDNAQIKKWLCYRSPCSSRLTLEAQIKADEAQSNPRQK